MTDFSDPLDISTLSDDELYDVVMDALRGMPELDVGWMELRVRDGGVTLEGRVPTDGASQVAEQVIVDVVGVSDFTNHLVVDETVEDGAPLAADDAALRDDEVDEGLGEEPADQSDTASHLEEDLDSATFGTRNVQEAISDGVPYVPPDRPVPDGYGSRDDH